MTLNVRTFVLLAAAGSLALLGGAFVFQALGYAPCKLCLWQRWPHAAAIAIGALILLTGWQGLAWAGALAALTTALLGIYHTGIERGLFAGPDTCTSNGVTGLSPDELMTQILNAPLVRCDEVAWSLMGLSMASWNAVLSLVLVALWVAAARRA
ncbi:MAG TPA: disulfide bond formation protein B [Paracoccaceae bacterium]|nr:disulfide bond formation protein B [Paracoccaceae bacterium]